MGFVLFILFVFLVISLFFTLLKKGRFAVLTKSFRWLTVVASIAFFVYWFMEKSMVKFQQNALTTQVINKLPQALDFYIIRIDKDPAQIYVTSHIGKIRPDHFRIEYLKMDNSDEFWIAGYLGKKNLVYFTQHSVPNKNMDQIVEINNYLVQSSRLANIAKKKIDEENYGNVILSIWISLSLLLLFLNLVLLIRGK